VDLNATAAGAASARGQAVAAQSQWLIPGAVALAATAALGLGLSLTRSISQRVAAVGAAAAQLERGDLTGAALDGGGDEIGQMAGAFSRMAAHLREQVGQVTQTAAAFAETAARTAAAAGDGAQAVREATAGMADLRRQV
jgi:methyl-accepting chemotaxis protein